MGKTGRDGWGDSTEMEDRSATQVVWQQTGRFRGQWGGSERDATIEKEKTKVLLIIELDRGEEKTKAPTPEHHLDRPSPLRRRPVDYTLGSSDCLTAGIENLVPIHLPCLSLRVRFHTHIHSLRLYDLHSVSGHCVPDICNRSIKRLRRPQRNRKRRVVQLSFPDASDYGTAGVTTSKHSYLVICVTQPTQMSPGSLALEGFTWPAPVAKRSAGVSLSSTICLPRLSSTSAVVMIADLIAAGDQSGCELLISAAIPLRWGHDMDVPDIMLKVEPKIGNDPTF
ncbi:hypothetical protein CKAN_02741900 [Cinnamomum micranthum f. kanehirae]|uniref:Uncharacterized protein n=1 Tax=Cinnamomum micranthum f. kanehirae TaxID=337451 RepID=A0A443Q4K2_9MAGN|nr:hypothetical protein CKAN_02741900 [Cinnamomum micranthum f. kanehirae]